MTHTRAPLNSQYRVVFIQLRIYIYTKTYTYGLITIVRRPFFRTESESPLRLPFLPIPASHLAKWCSRAARPRRLPRADPRCWDDLAAVLCGSRGAEDAAPTTASASSPLPLPPAQPQSCGGPASEEEATAEASGEDDDDDDDDNDDDDDEGGGGGGDGGVGDAGIVDNVTDNSMVRC